jgi:hypothetical protein
MLDEHSDCALQNFELENSTRPRRQLDIDMISIFERKTILS